jgi:hypothetical protein
MAITNGIKLGSSPLNAKAIAAIRKSTGLSIAEIKDRADRDEFLIEADLSDDKELQTMLSLADELAKHEIELEFFQGGYSRSREFMKNVYKAHTETAKEVGLER